MRLLASLLCVAALASCTVPSTAEIDAADVGPQPDQELCESYATNYLEQSLKDPMSAVIRFGRVAKGWYRKTQFSAGRYVWSMVASVNAKNSYGGYTGAQDYWFYFLGSEFVAVGAPSNVLVGSSYQTMTFITEFKE